MEEKNQEIRLATPEQKLANIILDSVERHQYYMRVVRMGGSSLEEIEKLNDNMRQQIRARSLNRVISFQRELITSSRPVVYFLCMKKWKEEYKTEELRTSNPFENEDNDYATLLLLLGFCKESEELIIKADKTKSLADDFIIWVDDSSGEKEASLTKNFYDMVENLEDSYEELYGIMLRNGILVPTIKGEERRSKANAIY